MRFYTLTTTLAVLSLAFITGCRQTVNTTQRAQSQAAPSYVDDHRIITDRGLGRIIHILSVNETTVSGDLLKIQVRLENTSKKPQTVNYFFEWYDVDGMLVSSASSAWESKRLQGKEVGVITAVARNSRVVDFIVKLQEPKR